MQVSKWIPTAMETDAVNAGWRKEIQFAHIVSHSEQEKQYIKIINELRKKTFCFKKIYQKRGL